MSVASEITRIQNAKSTLKTSIENKGVTVSDSTLLSGYAALVDQIETGGSSSDGLNLVDGTITEFINETQIRATRAYAFASCESLRKVKINAGFLQNYTFERCNSLTEVILGSSIWQIGYIFSTDLDKLTTLVIETSTVPTINATTFAKTPNLTIYVPDEAVEDYKAATNWSNYASIIKGISEKE